MAGNKSLLLQAAAPIGITATGGNGAIILSTIEMVSDADCEAAGLTADPANCANLYHAVFTKRILIGSNSFASAFDTGGPPATDSSGAVSQKNILKSVADRADSFSPPYNPKVTSDPSAVLLMVPGQIAYVGESFLQNDDLVWTGFVAKPISSRSIF